MKIRIDSIELNYEIVMPNGARHYDDADVVIIFLHEALGSIPQWKQFPQQLCSGLNLPGIIYDRQGHGHSDPFIKQRDANYLHTYALEELPLLVAKISNPNQKVLLLGHSDGGSIALLYAHQYPENIEGVITMAAHVINEPETIAGIEPAVKAYEKGKLDGLKKFHSEKTNDLFYAWADIWRDSSFLDWNITHEIGGHFPGLFIQGAEDQYGTERQLELIKEKHPNGTTCLTPNCGHHPHLQQSETILELIADWYSKG
jgi:pimeloyl-ACP methyl ester carboxylesterase